MKVGLDTFTLHPLTLSPREILDYIHSHGLAGAQFGGPGSLSAKQDPGEMRELHAYADSLGLYTHVSVSSPNPHLEPGGLTLCTERLTREIPLMAQGGWHELHSSLGNDTTRFRHAVPWAKHLADSAQVLRQLAPVLRDYGSRINLEDHGDTTTFDLVRLAEEVGPDICGICLDTANVLCLAEDPVAAARRVAPYTHLTHTKDAIVYFCDNGIRRQGRPPGQGVVNWEQVLPILAEYSPDLPLSIEDHKWLFDAGIFIPSWLASIAEVPREDIVEVVRLAWSCEQKITAGLLPKPEAYEAIPFIDQLEDRLAFGRDYLNSVLSRLGLAG